MFTRSKLSLEPLNIDTLSPLYGPCVTSPTPPVPPTSAPWHAAAGEM